MGAGVPAHVTIQKLDAAYGAVSEREGDGRNELYRYMRAERTVTPAKAFALGEALRACGVSWSSGPIALLAAGYDLEFIKLLRALATDGVGGRIAFALLMYAPWASEDKLRATSSAPAYRVNGETISGENRILFARGNIAALVDDNVDVERIRTSWSARDATPRSSVRAPHIVAIGDAAEAVAGTYALHFDRRRAAALTQMSMWAAELSPYARDLTPLKNYLRFLEAIVEVQDVPQDSEMLVNEDEFARALDPSRRRLPTDSKRTRRDLVEV